MNIPQYKDYVGLIKAEAWKRVYRNPLVDVEELISQGSLAFEKALRTWEPAKGKFSTHLWWKLQEFMGKVQGCRNYAPQEPTDEPTRKLSTAEKKAIFHSSMVPLDDAMQVASVGEGTLDEIKLRSGISGLSQEAMEVVWLILACPWELVDWTMKQVRPSQESIRILLRSVGKVVVERNGQKVVVNLNWPHKKIDTAFSEVKAMLEELQ